MKNNDMHIDLTLPEFRSLSEPGSWKTIGAVTVARISDEEFAAVSSRCSHNGKQIVYNPDTYQFECVSKARFDIQGNGLNKRGKKGLTTYQCDLEGNILWIHSWQSQSVQ